MPDPALRVIGTSVTLAPRLQEQARRDLGFPIRFEVLDGPSCQQRGVARPESYDIYDQWFHSVDLLWTSGAIEPIDTGRIERWDQIWRQDCGEPVPSRPAETCGTRPTDVLFIQHDNTLGPGPASLISMLPTTYNADSFAYRHELSGDLRESEQESWAWLLDERWIGRCLLADDPASSVVELALASSAAGLLEFGDLGNLTVEEIDALFEVLMNYRRAGHFGRFWVSSEASVRQMAQPGSALGSLWSPAFYQLRALGQDLVYAAPKEGFRGWHSGLCLSSSLRDDMRDKAYAYLNWWLSGVPGAMMARQGYYMSVVEPLTSTLGQAEWDYWYGGCSAPTDLPTLDGASAVQAGERRSGGSYLDRVSRITAWSTIMDEHNYIVRRWRDFIDS